MQHIKDVKVVLFDPNQDLRILIHGILRDSGFAEIISTDRADMVRDRLENEHVDLLIGDVHDVNGATCTLVSDLRCGRLGKNPFPVAIALTDDAEETTITKIVNAGFDGLSLKPFDTTTFKRRIEYFLGPRKPFVTTADYIGPDRRKTPGKPGVDSNCVDAPNSLRLIAEGISRKTVEQMAEDAAAKLDDCKFTSDVGGIGWCADNLARAIADNNDELMAECVRQLDEIARDMDARLERTSYRKEREHCNSLLAVVARIAQADAIPANTDVSQLNDLVDAISLNCDIERQHAA